MCTHRTERNPFGEPEPSLGLDVREPWEWSSIDRLPLIRQFNMLNPIDGRLAGQTVRPVMLDAAKGVSNADLGKIWGLADMEAVSFLF